MAGPQRGIDANAVADGQPGGLGQLDVGLDAQSGHHGVDGDLVLASRGDVPRADPQSAFMLVDAEHLFFRPNSHALVPIELVEERGQVAGEHAAADAGLGEDHHHVVARRRGSQAGQGRGDFRADEPAADHREPLMLLGQAVEPVVIVQGAEVDHRVRAGGEPPRRAAGGEEEFLEAVDRPLVVDDVVVGQIERHGGASGIDRPLLDRRPPPNAVERSSFPEPLGEWRTIVRRVDLGVDHSDRPDAVHLADAAHGRVGGHSSADDEILIIMHGLPLIGFG